MNNWLKWDIFYHEHGAIKMCNCNICKTHEMEALRLELEEIERYFGIFGTSKLNVKFQTEFNDLIIKMYFEKYPRRRKAPTLNIKFFEQEPEIVTNARLILTPKAEQFLEFQQSRKLEIIDIFRTVELPKSTDEFHEIIDISSSAYHTQGFGAKRYAIASIEKYMHLLIHYGYNAHIGDVTYYTHLHYAVFANCPKWTLTALLMRVDDDTFTKCITLANANNGTNQLVFDNEALIANHLKV